LLERFDLLFELSVFDKDSRLLLPWVSRAFEHEFGGLDSAFGHPLEEHLAVVADHRFVLQINSAQHAKLVVSAEFNLEVVVELLELGKRLVSVFQLGLGLL
jgi:hypothetical protein